MKKRKRFSPPSLTEVKNYIDENPELANVNAYTFWKGFSDSDWIDTRGNPVRNWKLKLWTWSHFSDKKVKPKKCIHCNKIGVYTDKDDTGQIYWLCEDHKPVQKPLPKDTPVPQMKKVPGGVNINDARNKNLDALGIK